MDGTFPLHLSANRSCGFKQKKVSPAPYIGSRMEDGFYFTCGAGRGTPFQRI